MIRNRDSVAGRFLGRWALLHGFCPRCNSDAPEVYECAVCKMAHENGQNRLVKNHREMYPPNRATKAYWWYLWMHPGLDNLQSNYDAMGN
ncbi:MAG: hypothetical protein KAV87_00300 [Desulfobacteraceae bacterium]|nr:hypothetical protein [Desulfobacteraceae bacterium]